MCLEDIEKIVFGIPKLFNSKHNAYFIDNYYNVGARPSRSYQVLVNMLHVCLCHGSHVMNKYKFSLLSEASRCHMLKPFLLTVMFNTRKPIDDVNIEIAIDFDECYQTLEFNSLDELLVKVDIADVVE